MKTFNIAILFILITFGSTLAQNVKTSRIEKKAIKKALLIQQTTELIDSVKWQFNANEMVPMSGISKHLTSPYYVTINDTIIDSYLPYFGRAYSAEYASSESPMTFTAIIKDNDLKNKQKKGWLIKLKTTNKTDILIFTFSISPDGYATLNVNSVNRQPITYYGEIVRYYNKN